MKWKRPTMSLVVTVAGAMALAPLRTSARQPDAANPDTPATSQPAATAGASAPGPSPETTAAAPYDPIAILNSTSADVTQAQRDEAAQRLLSRDTDAARQSLYDALVKPNSAAQLAVAVALAQDPNPNPLFIDPLFPLLDNREVAAAASRALSGYKSDREVLTRLIATAQRNAAYFTRQAAISAIGTLAEKRGAAVLIQLLLSPDERSEIHAAAAGALTNLTGLEKNGEDATRWSAWWNTQANKSDAQFRTEIEAQKDARLDRLDARYRSLVSAVERLMRQEYNGAAQEQRQDLMLSFLNSPQIEVRKIGTKLLSEDVDGGRRIYDTELARLRYLIADSDPGVRGAAATAISKINDPGALDALLEQLKVEPDPTVRAAIAAALGPIHNLKAVPTLIALLSDSSLETAEHAARALEDLAQDKLPTDPTQALNTARALRDTILRTSQTPGSEDLRVACIQALTPLLQTAIVQDLLDHKLNLAGKEASDDVRAAMMDAIAALKDPHFARLISRSLVEDPSSQVQLEAIKALENNPLAAQYDQLVGGLLAPNPAITPEMHDEAWKFMQGIFPKLSEEQLSQWSQRLTKASDQLIALEALRDQEERKNESESLAATDMEIGDDYVSLKKYDQAVASYRAALQFYKPKSGGQAVLALLVRNYMNALLEDRQYSDAVQLAADQINSDPSEQSAMGALIANKVGELIDKATPTPTDLNDARQLIDLASKMKPPLDTRHQDMLNSYAQAIKNKSSSLDAPGPLPQSATVDGK